LLECMRQFNKLEHAFPVGEESFFLAHICLWLRLCRNNNK
jgi:uncharacterized membrane protein YhhN